MSTECSSLIRDGKFLGSNEFAIERLGFWIEVLRSANDDWSSEKKRMTRKRQRGSHSKLKIIETHKTQPIKLTWIINIMLSTAEDFERTDEIQSIHASMKCE